MNKIYAVIIIYNKYIKNSIAIKKIRAFGSEQYKIIVFDNSLSDFQIVNKDYAKKNNIKYYHSNKNRGLSYAYNCVIRDINKTNKDDLVLLLDDDTKITYEFLENLAFETKKNPNFDVYMPLIVGQNGIFYSPNEKGKFKSKLKQFPVKEIDKSKINGINSCTTIRLKVFEQFQYDEGLFVDCVDDYFFDFVRKEHLKVFIMNVIIKQRFSQREESISVKSMLTRFRIRIIDNMHYYNKTLDANIIGFVRCFGWSIQYALILRSLLFFNKCGSLSLKLFCLNIWHRIYRRNCK